ncbi:hypothetical protein BD779DRAFT_1547752 [Infundibulicybe gibba]|nr:hypothetical protein BD779DRAFT_1547752 [Infundibulicybe gibba]
MWRRRRCIIHMRHKLPGKEPRRMPFRTLLHLRRRWRVPVPPQATDGAGRVVQHTRRVLRAHAKGRVGSAGHPPRHTHPITIIPVGIIANGAAWARWTPTLANCSNGAHRANTYHNTAPVGGSGHDLVIIGCKRRRSEHPFGAGGTASG